MSALASSRRIAATLLLVGGLLAGPAGGSSARASVDGEGPVDAPASTIEYRVERLSFSGLPTGTAEREFERILNRWARQGWILDEVLEWSPSSALILLRR